MNELPKSVQERLEALRRSFLEALPQRVREMEALMEGAVEDDRETIRELRLRVHRIAGSAATFDLMELGTAARDLEAYIEWDLATEAPAPSERTRNAFAAFCDLARSGKKTEDPPASHEDDNDAPVGERETVPGEESESLRGKKTETPPKEDRKPGASEQNGIYDRVVILVGDIGGLPRDFGDQVSVFRFAVSFAEDIEAVPEFCEERLHHENTRERYRYVVLVATDAYFAGNPTRLKTLTSLRKRFGRSVVLFLVGNEDDFETRLRSVRYGADAFLPTPVDITQFVDSVDRYTTSGNPEPYHIMIVDDDPEQVSDTALVLQEAGMVTTVVTDPRNIFKVLVEYRPELVLLDMYMPECTGSELAAIIRQNENFVGVPILYLSVETDQEKQLSAIRSGGDGFLVKPIDPEHLVTSVSVRARRTRAMRFYMERDSLTGLLNHTNLKQHLEHEIQRAGRIGLPLVFAMVDLDRFKQVNDTYGHLTGDRVIKSLSRLLQERLRRSDTIGRYGGEEFGVILFNTDLVQARKLMEEVRESFSRIRQSDGHQEFTVTLSCGIAEFPAFVNAAAINEAADAALYEAKEQGRNRVVTAKKQSN